MRKFSAVIVLGVLGAAALSAWGQEARKSAGGCDRHCLEGFVNQYLNAMVAHDPSRAPFARNVKFTENAKSLPIFANREGLWTSSTALGDYKYYVADPQAAQVAFVGLVREGDKPALLSMRLKVESNRITEAETVVVRTLNERNLWTLATPPPAFSESLAPEERVSRAELIRISNAYFDGIVQLTAKNVPFADDCYRLENGMWTAGPKLPRGLAANMPKQTDASQDSRTGASSAFGRGPCAQALDSGVFALIESIQPRRTPVVDEERGVTWGVYMFNHPGVETIKAKDGTTQPAAYFRGQPNSMPMSELFKIRRGKIYDIMAIGVVNGYKSGTGWE